MMGTFGLPADVHHHSLTSDPRFSAAFSLCRTVAGALDEVVGTMRVELRSSGLCNNSSKREERNGRRCLGLPFSRPDSEICDLLP